MWSRFGCGAEGSGFPSDPAGFEHIGHQTSWLAAPGSSSEY